MTAHFLRKKFGICAGALLLAACQSVPLSDSVSEPVKAAAPFGLLDPDSSASPERAGAQWLNRFNDPLLRDWVDRAINDNFSLAEARYRVEAARQQRRASGASLWPSLDLGSTAERRKTADSARTSEYSASASLAWELDLWGKLYDGFKADDLRLQAEQASLEAARVSLAGQVAKAWYQLVASQQLSSLFEQRVSNLQTNLDIISSGYRQGINNALDVYLARSDLASEQSNLSAQQEQTREATRQLQLLLGEYPSGQLPQLEPGSLSLPSLPALSTATFVTDSVRQRYDLQASFLALAAADRELAAAHKARFPSLTIRGSAGDSSDDFSQLFDGGALAWNLLAGLTQPLFAGGELQARERQRLAELRQLEQRYLQALQTAFAEIEQALTNDGALGARLQQLIAAKTDAEAAEALAFEQYRQGLVSYTAVLEAQRRAFNAQSSVINLRNQLLQNQINMYLALGADY
ncbi:efflux transporter outer membrane subunit [Pseudomaricurvus alcaniphilus]|uniref:efflux transporter outer membrane subunit n=1 Tax=Pseudomaricurvus alcaniphilus TaxID=1166482 RepID=UPI003132DE53